ncbi:MAG: tripartite tricarboxylate transporter substrate binding protein [Burkholderiales bacterium]|jgi:tripartite-type tricarboxylate transporter receptor subunit TctC|nr:tripartite tricarboxylate transporter substrate binding protein [Burkholderiales bacterium]
MSITRRRALAASAALVASSSWTLAQAQPAGWPARPITLVVAYPAGGDTDALARLVGEKLSARIGQPVVVDNRAGAAGAIGTTYVSRAAADGYTLLLAPNTVVITPHVNTSAAYDPVGGLTPVAQLISQSLFVMVHPGAGVNSMQELVAAAKAGRITSYASPGNGSPMHILGELFNKSAGVSITQVPYKGGAPAIADVVAGHVPMMYMTLAPVAQYVNAGRLKVLAVADPQRSPFLPNVPTLAEQGFRDADVGAWQALFAPRGLPSDLVRVLNQHVNEIIRLPDVAERMKSLAQVAAGGDAAKLGTLASQDYARYGRVVKEFGIRAD